MLQFYFLAVVLNATAGYLLFFGEEGGIAEAQCEFLKNETFKLVLGILSVITGLLKLLSPVEGNVPIIGDLFPAVTVFLCGFIFVYEYYKTRSTVEVPEHPEKIGKVLIGYKKIIGMAALIAAVLHFLFPTVLLL